MQRGAVQGIKATVKPTISITAATPPIMRRAGAETEQEPSEPIVPDTPVPDYDSHDTDEEPGVVGNRRSSITFVNNFRNVITNIRTIEELYSNFPEPDPDYHDGDDDDENDLPPPPPPLTAEELSAAVSEAYDSQVNNGVSMSGGSRPEDNPPLIRPKPLHNPCLESKERQALHRELLMNYKIGKDVLKKPELNKVLRERREKERKKEWDEQKSKKGRSSLELKLEERANKVKEEEEKKMQPIAEDDQGPELTRVHRKIMLRSVNDAK